MPYVPYKPLWVHRLLLSLRSVFYAFAAVAGFGALFYTPRTLDSIISTTITQVWGGVVLVAALIALGGVVVEQYRVEFVVLPFIVAGIIIYAITVWFAVYDTSTRLAQAGALSALATITTIRLLDLLIVHRKLTAQHELE